MSSTVTAMPPMLSSIDEEDLFETASVRILPATPAQVIPASAGSGSGAIKTYISVFNGEEEYVVVDGVHTSASVSHLGNKI